MPTALVTGAAQRIGKIIALALAHHGWNLVLHYNSSAEEAIKTQKLIEDLGRSAELLQCNFLMPGEIEQLKISHSLDLLVNNAAIFNNDHLDDFTSSGIENHLRVNLIAPMILTQKFITCSKASQNPNIINLLDCKTCSYPSNFLSYHISKNSLDYFTKIAAENLAPDIRVNSIALGQTIQNQKQSTENFNHDINNSKLKKIVSEKNLVDTLFYLVHNNNATGNIIYLKN